VLDFSDLRVLVCPEIEGSLIVKHDAIALVFGLELFETNINVIWAEAEGVSVVEFQMSQMFGYIPMEPVRTSV